MKKVLVTGGSGFIGRHLVADLLRRGHIVHALDLPGMARAPEGMQANFVAHDCDLLSADSVESIVREVRAEQLVHLAWYTAHGKFWNATENLAWTQASLALVRAFCENGGKRMVGAGTCAEYDWSGPRGILDEAAACRPASLYGVCKHSLFSIISRYAELNGLSFAWGRVFFLYGPGEDRRRLVPSLIEKMLKREAAVVRFGSHERNLIHTEDAGRAFAEIAESDVTGPVNIAGPDSMMLGDIACKLAAQIDGGESNLIVHQEEDPSNPRVLIGVTDRLLRETGFRFEKRLDLEIPTLIREIRGTQGDQENV